MWGYFLGVFSVFGVIWFSLCLFLSNNLVMFWLFLELSTLCLVPLFFLRSEGAVLESLFNYLIVSSVSSSLIVSGIIFEDLLFLCFLGLLIKFGVFPFMGWVYKILINSNWWVVWSFSVFLKMPFIFICFFLSCGGGLYLLNFSCCITFFVLGVGFWYYTYSWYLCWSHMMLSSSAVFVAMSLGGSLEFLLILFAVYGFWASLVILYFYFLSDSGLNSGVSYFFYIVLLLSIPVSFSVFYKVLSGVLVYVCYFPVFVAWCLYSISEQVYLLCYIIGVNSSFEGYGGMSLV